MRHLAGRRGARRRICWALVRPPPVAGDGGAWRTCEAVAWASLGDQTDADATAMLPTRIPPEQDVVRSPRPPRGSGCVPELVEPEKYARSGT